MVDTDELYTRDVEVGFCVAYVVTMLVALVGNALVLRIVHVRVEVRGLTSFLFVNLALTDLLVALFVMPVSLSILYHEGVWSLSDVQGSLFCDLFFFAAFAVLAAPTITHLAIAVDRFYAVVLPLRPAVHYRKAKYLVPLIWLVTLAMTTPVLIIADFENEQCTYDFANIGLTYKEGRRFFNVYVPLVFLVPLAAMAVLYGLVGHKLWFYKPPGEIDERNLHRSKQKNRGIVKMLVTFIVVFALFWLPANVNHLVMAHSEDFFPVLTVAFNWIAHAHSAINPWLLIAVHPRYAAAFSQMVRRRNQGSRALGSPGNDEMLLETLPCSSSNQSSRRLKSAASTAV